ncbi:NEK10 kinase, partial [Climacteris rufus]|nr:NEK10 kinase [Climacteris rufus]
KTYEGVPVLLSLLHSDHIKLLWSIVRILVQVSEDPEISMEIQIWGGIKQLLHILQGERSLVSDCSSVGRLSSANVAGTIRYSHLSDDPSPDEMQENTFSLQAARCTAITELVLNETNVYQVVQVGKFYSVKHSHKGYQHRSLKSLCCGFRATVYIVSKRQKNLNLSRLFATDFFEIFIDIGHYVHDIRAYEGLVSKLNSLKEDVLKQIAESIEGIDQNKTPTRHVGNYAILEHLDSGAFGSVYKV